MLSQGPLSVRLSGRVRIPEQFDFSGHAKGKKKDYDRQKQLPRLASHSAVLADTYR